MQWKDERRNKKTPGPGAKARKCPALLCYRIGTVLVNDTAILFLHLVQVLEQSDSHVPVRFRNGEPERFVTGTGTPHASLKFNFHHAGVIIMVQDCANNRPIPDTSTFTAIALGGELRVEVL